MDSTALEAILEVSIGMIFMWLILSVATMTIQEWVASYLKWRAKNLETAIQRLLADKAWAEQLYNHPLIAGLSKKAGKKPSYIPANKFALALFDIVQTAGTHESFIQQKLLIANHELKKAPNQLFPFLGYVFKRFGTSIGRGFSRLFLFLGRKKGTPDQKHAAIVSLTQRLIHSNDPEKSEDLAQSLKQIFEAVLIDKTEINGKSLSLPSAEFLKAYPVFRDYFYDLLKVILKNQPNLMWRWSEILVYNNEELVNSIKEGLIEGETRREKLRKLTEEYARQFDINEEDLESIILCTRQTLNEMDFSPLVDYIQGLIGSSTQGLDALQKLNPSLHKSLQQMYGDFIGVANNSNMMKAVREEFAKVALKAGDVDQNLATLRLNAETWFNESMDRLSGWYKRKSMLLAFLIGLILATILNVDTIALAEHLWKDPSIRQALAANATEFTKENTKVPVVEAEDGEGPATPGDAIKFFEAQFVGLDVPLGWTFESAILEEGKICRLIPFGEGVEWGIEERIDTDQDLVADNVEATMQEETVNQDIKCQVINNAPTDSAGWFLKVMGIVLSAGAAAQGSPFWFDILKKLVNVRGSGVNPDEKSK